MPTSTQGGTVSLTGRHRYLHTRTDFEGTDTFFYQVQDNGTSGGVPDPQTSTGTVTVTVTGVNDSPVVSSPFGTVTMTEDQSAQVIDLSTVFFDPDLGDTLTFTIPTMATVTWIGDANDQRPAANARIVTRSERSGDNRRAGHR